MKRIESFKSANELVVWAREVVANDTASSESDVEEFRSKCNEQYALLTK